MAKYSQHVSTKVTPQKDAIPIKQQTKNNAGGYVFEISPWVQFERFLILGTEAGTYYVGERKMTQEAAKAATHCIKEDGLRAVRKIVEVSHEGRAIKNDPAIFALALACAHGDQDTKKEAYKSITAVCRIGTHLFQFCQAIQDLRGWSRGLRKGVGAFYLNRKIESLAMQLVKYRQRDGWTHRDVLRLAHPKPKADPHGVYLKWAVGKGGAIPEESLIGAYERAQEPGVSNKALAKMVRDYRLPREALPTTALDSREVWEALLEDMPITALIRNLGKMTSIELFKSNLDSNVKSAVSKITDQTRLIEGRVHPMALLLALTTYSSGAGFRGKLSWKPVRSIIDALDKAFYLAFKAVEPTGQNMMLALDVSGSMESAMSGTNLSCRDASAAMALVTAATEPNHEIVGFYAGTGGMKLRGGRGLFGGDSGITPLAISPRQRLDDAVKVVSDLPFGGTDCALPMLYAIEKKLEVDTFVIYTDNETWAGHIHPCQALQKYRKASGRKAKLVVVGMTATKFSIADPEDNGMLDVVGFDISVPQAISAFARA